jgi:hypothetical protein
LADHHHLHWFGLYQHPSLDPHHMGLGGLAALEFVDYLVKVQNHSSLLLVGQNQALHPQGFHAL